MSLPCSACESIDFGGSFQPRYAMPVVRPVNGIHPDKSHKAYRKLVEQSALVVSDNLLFHRLPSWSNKDGSKI
jgi:hypothetical protein